MYTTSAMVVISQYLRNADKGCTLTSESVFSAGVKSSASASLCPKSFLLKLLVDLLKEKVRRQDDFIAFPNSDLIVVDWTTPFQQWW